LPISVADLITLGEKASFFKIMDLQCHLEDLLGIKVDLATPRALKPRTRPSIERDLIHVA
jgi:predicted nucleotidyltransferase